MNDNNTAPAAAELTQTVPLKPDEWQQAIRAQLATVSGGLAPDVYVNAWWDWYLNLAKDPAKQLQIVQDALAKTADNWSFAVRAANGEPLSPAEGDARYANDAWSHWPFNVYAHSYRNAIDWWQKSWSGVAGVSPESERSLEFVARNAAEVISPSNYLATNPELLDATRAESVKTSSGDSATGSRMSNGRCWAKRRAEWRVLKSAAISRPPLEK